MSSLVETTRFQRGRLPHWEVKGGRYFVTVRCHDSLPREAVARLAEINASVQAVTPASPQFAVLQRRYFAAMEKYLDAGTGSSALRDPRAAAAIVRVFEEAEADGALISHYTIMSNHIHALIVAKDAAPLDLHRVMTRFKGRSARAVNKVLGRTGALWQHEWFDRWMRDDAEWDRTVAYVRNNPVKAGLAKTWQAHLWTK